MKKLFGIVFVTFALSLVAGPIISCSQQAPANQGNQTGNTGGNNGGNNSSTAKFVYRAQPKENRPVVDVCIFLFNQGSFIWKILADENSNDYSEILTGTYTIANGMVTCTVRWTVDPELQQEHPVGSKINLRILPNGDLSFLDKALHDYMLLNKISGMLQ